MTVYTYSVKSLEGKTVTGAIRAEEKSAFRQKIKQENLCLIRFSAGDGSL